MTKHFHKILSDSEKLVSDIMQRAIEEHTGQGIESIEPSRIHTSALIGDPDAIYLYVDGGYIGKITRVYEPDLRRLQIKFHPPGPVDNGPPESQLDRRTPEKPTDLEHLVTFLTHAGTSPVVNDLAVPHTKSVDSHDHRMGFKLIRLAGGDIDSSPFRTTISNIFSSANDNYIDYLFTNEGELIDINVWEGN